MNSLRLCSMTLLSVLVTVTYVCCFTFYFYQKQKQVTESMNKYLQDYKVLQEDDE